MLHISLCVCNVPSSVNVSHTILKSYELLVCFHCASKLIRIYTTRNPTLDNQSFDVLGGRVHIVYGSSDLDFRGDIQFFVNRAAGPTGRLAELDFGECCLFSLFIYYYIFSLFSLFPEVYTVSGETEKVCCIITK